MLSVQFLGHGLGCGLAAGDECGLFFGETDGLGWFHCDMRSLPWRRVEFAESKSKDAGWTLLFEAEAFQITFQIARMTYGARLPLTSHDIFPNSDSPRRLA